MDIMLEIVSRQKFSASFPVSHVFGEAGGYIGRSDECEWVLPDRSKQISRKHALIAFDEGAFYIEDLSSNGVYLSLGHEGIGKGRRHKIEHGEGFVIGEYTFMARLLHNPGAYAASASTVNDDLLSFSQPLSLHPLVAMDQEEEIIARQRLGDFDDLLEQRKVVSLRPSDHSDPKISTLQPVVAVPEHTTFLPEDWNSDPDETEDRIPTAPSVTMHAAPTRSALPSIQEPETISVPVPETDIFFKALGFSEAPTAPAERERVLRLAAELLVVSVDGITQALQNRAECKNELRLPVTTTSLAVNNNPLKFNPTAEAALADLLGQPQKGVLPAVKAMRDGFHDLHSHHMGLLAGARAAVRASLDKVSPQAVEARLDLNGPVRFRRTNRLWHTFIRMHRALHDDHEGFAGLFLQDFARAYEMQGRTLNPATYRASKGERK